MRLADSPEQRAFRLRLRTWLSRNVARSYPPRDWSEAELRTWSKSLAQAGYTGLTWPAEHGGRDLPATFAAIYAEETALAGAPEHINVLGLNMVGPAIIRHGSAAQRARYLPGILSGETVFCQGFSEPDAGSDLAAVRTSARLGPGGYVLDGEKVWSSYAHLADHCLLLARTGQDGERHRGLTCFLLDLRTPGVVTRPLRQLSGDATFNQIVLTGAVTPAESVLGEVGDGWRVAMTTLAHERGTFGVTLTARLAARLDLLVTTVRELDRDNDPTLRRRIAELHVLLEGLRYTGYRALAASERTGEPGPEASVLKLRWAEGEQRLTALAAEVVADRPDVAWHEYWLQERLRARAASIEGGTTEILRGIIAQRVLGLPRSR